MTNSNSGDPGNDVSVLFDMVRIVLVGTTHPGNIGASARAMKAMGFSELSLVAPRTFPAAAAIAMASGADDILAAARVVDSLSAALDGCAMVFGTTARDRHLSWPILSPKEAAVEARAALAHGQVAMVFGREQAGLSNAELDLCQRAIRIPTAPDFNSLNLAQAVQVCVYELRNSLSGPSPIDASDAGERDRVATAEELDRLYRHLIETMLAVDYFDAAHPKLLERRIRRLLNRSNLRQSETQILRGFLTSVGQRLRDR